MRGLNRGGKNSFDDFGWYIKSFEVGMPTKRKVEVAVPYRSSNYDFSDLYGMQAYDNRTLTVTFNRQVPVDAQSPYFSQFCNWLMDGVREETTDDRDPGWYYIAECTGLEAAENLLIDTVKATFTAEPFKTRIYDSDDVPWDEFNFLTDALNPDYVYTGPAYEDDDGVSGELKPLPDTLTYVNLAPTPVTLYVKLAAKGSATITANGKTYTFTNSGNWETSIPGSLSPAVVNLSRSYAVCRLPPGETTIAITDNGITGGLAGQLAIMRIYFRPVSL